MSAVTVFSLNFLPISLLASERKQKKLNTENFLRNREHAVAVLEVKNPVKWLDSRLEIIQKKKVLTEYSVCWVHCHLVFSCVADKTFRVGESDITGSCTIPLVVGNDFNFSMLENTNAGICCAKINSYCFWHFYIQMTALYNIYYWKFPAQKLHRYYTGEKRNFCQTRGCQPGFWKPGCAKARAKVVYDRTIG